MVKRVVLKNFRGLDCLEVGLSSATMLTGVNGVGKTSVLEGLYCLFSETRLNVSSLSRYTKSFVFNINHGVNSPFGAAVREGYNYKLFWDECPSHGNSECTVKAVSDNDLIFSWNYRKAYISDLDKPMTANSPIPIDSSSEFALWHWKRQGKSLNKKTRQIENVNNNFKRAQILAPDGGLYLLPGEARAESICQYIDFANFRLLPHKLSFNTAKQLTKALQIINPHITDVRLKDTETGLSVVLNNENEVSLGTLGNGAVTWACTLITIFNLADLINQQQNVDIPTLVLLDEMCAGIHYSVMLDVWKFIASFLEQNKSIQFVFTSHSDDCVRAFCESFADKESGSIVRLHRRAKENTVVPTEYKKEAFQNIIDGDWEVRG